MGMAQILMVDDDKMAVALASSVLKKHGYEVHCAYDGVDGLQKAKEVKPDLIILDIMMPRMNGYEVCHRLKMDMNTANIPVLMLTSKGGVDDEVSRGWEAATRIQDRMQGYDSGAIEFLTKPVTAKDLVKRVKFVLWSGGHAK